MGIVFHQRDASSANDPFCSGLAPGVSTTNFSMSDGAVFGTTEHSATIQANQTPTNVYLFSVLTATNEPGAATWDAGSWVLRVDHSTGNAAVRLGEVHICRTDAAGVSLGTVTNLTGVTNSTTGGELEFTFTVPSVTAATTNRIGVVLGYWNSSGTQRTVGITPRSLFVVPIGTNFTELSGRTVCSAPRYTGIWQDLVGRTVSVSLGRGDLSIGSFLDLDGRTVCSAPRYTVPAAPTPLELVGRTMASATARGDLGLALDLDGRTVCSAPRYTVPATPTSLELVGRTVCSSLGRGDLSRILQLDGRTVCSAPRYTVPVAPVTTFLELQGRSTASSTARGGLGVDLELQGRTVCSGVRYTVASVVTGALDLVGRTICYSTAKGTAAAPLAAFLELDGRTVSSSTVQGALTQLLPGEEVRELQGRTVSASTVQGALTQVQRLTGRVVCTSFDRGALGPEVNELVGRTACVVVVRGTLSQLLRVTPVPGTFRGTITQPELIGHFRGPSGRGSIRKSDLVGTMT